MSRPEDSNMSGVIALFVIGTAFAVTIGIYNRTSESETVVVERLPIEELTDDQKVWEITVCFKPRLEDGQKLPEYIEVDWVATGVGGLGYERSTCDPIYKWCCSVHDAGVRQFGQGMLRVKPYTAVQDSAWFLQTNHRSGESRDWPKAMFMDADRFGVTVRRDGSTNWFIFPTARDTGWAPESSLRVPPRRRR